MTMRRLLSSNDQPRSDHPDNAWHRWHWIWSGVFYVSFIVPFLVFVADFGTDSGERFSVAALTLAAIAAQVLVGIYLPRRHPSLVARRAVGYAYLAVLVVTCVGLVTIHPSFFFVIGGIFSQMFYTQPIQRSLAASLILTALLIFVQVWQQGLGMALRDPGTWVFVFTTGMGIVLALWIGSIIAQSDQRGHLIQELQETQIKLAAVERERGILSERQRLAREIHDTLAQGFTSIVMHLEAADQAMLPDTPDAVRHHLDQARQTARESLTQARHVVADLRPDILAQASLPKALERVTLRWQEQSGIPATFTATGQILPLHPDMDVTLLRLTQEALANVAKHAQANTVAVTLSYMGDTVALDVQDDGLGIQPGSPAGDAPRADRGFGLVGMRERVAQLGGSLEIESAPGQGTTVAAVIPVG